MKVLVESEKSKVVRLNSEIQNKNDSGKEVTAKQV
jgi:hypothetical protein